MTTNVDILFKELPNVAGPHERKNVSDISPSASSHDGDETQLSKNIDGNDKSFTDHLNEQQPRTAENDTDTRSNDADRNQNEKLNNTSGHQNDQKEQSSIEFNENTAQSLQNDTTSVATKTVTAHLNGRSQTTSAPTADYENQPASDQPPQGSSSSNGNNSENSLNIIAQSNHNSGGEVLPSTPNANEKSGDNVSTSKQEISTSIISATQETSSDNAQTKISEVIVPQTTEIDKLTVSTHVDNRSLLTNVAKPEAKQDVITDAHQVAAQSNQTSANPATSTPDTDLEKNGIFDKSKKPENIGDSQTVTPENKTPLNPVTIEMAASQQEQSVMETKVPTDTVIVEATRTIPVAVVPNPISPSKVSNAPSKSNISVTGETSKSNVNAASNTANNSNSNQAATSSSVLTNTIKSDIQVDLNTVAQKSEPAPLLSPTLTNQGQLTNNSLLAIQDVAALPKSENVLPTTIRNEASTMSRMINEQITVAINRQVVNGQNNFSIKLHPAELGKVDIRLEFATDGKMQASMVVENERTLSLLQRDQNALEKALQEAGINLSNKDLNFSLMKQNQENNGQKFADVDQSSDEARMGDELAHLNPIQEISMGYSNQSIDISV